MWAAARVILTWVFGDDVLKVVLYVIAGLFVFAYSATCSAVRSVESQPYGQYWLAGGPAGAQAIQPVAIGQPGSVVAQPTVMPLPAVTGGRAATIIANAMTWLGVRYLWGGCTLHGVDCSCFVRNAFLSVGVSIPRTTTEQIRFATPISGGQAVATDLVFFDNTCSACGANPTHVGLVLGNGMMIDAGDPVRIEPIYSGHNARYGRVLP